MNTVSQFFHKDIHSPSRLFTLQYLPITISAIVLTLGIPFSVYLAANPQPQETASHASELMSVPASSLTLTTPQEGQLVTGKMLHVTGTGTPLSNIVVTTGDQAVLATVTPAGFFTANLAVTQGPVRLTVLDNNGQLTKDIAVADVPCLVGQSQNTSCPFGWVGKVTSVVSAKQTFTVQTPDGVKQIMASQAQFSTAIGSVSLATLKPGDQVMVFGHGVDTITATKVIKEAPTNDLSMLEGTIASLNRTNGVSITLSSQIDQPLVVAASTKIYNQAKLASTQALAAGQKIVVLVVKNVDQTASPQAIFILP